MKKNQEKVTIIGNDVHINGTISSSGTVEINGKIETKNLSCKKMIVSEEGSVSGNIFVTERAVIAGEIVGCITAQECNMTKTSKVTGSVTYETLSVEKGASIEGTYTIKNSDDMFKNNITKSITKIPNNSIEKKIDIQKSRPISLPKTDKDIRYTRKNSDNILQKKINMNDKDVLEDKISKTLSC